VILAEWGPPFPRKFTAWSASVANCPKMTEPNLVYVDYACNDIGGSNSPDVIWTLKKEDCEILPKDNLIRIQKLFLALKPGTNLKTLLDHRLYPTGLDLSEKGSFKFYFRSIPAVHLTVYVNRIGKGSLADCWKNLELCSIDGFKPPKIQLSFSLRGECEMARKKDPNIDCREQGELDVDFKKSISDHKIENLHKSSVWNLWGLLSF